MKSRTQREQTDNLKQRFNSDAACLWADQIVAVFPGFDSERFVRLASRGLNTLELKARIQRFARALAETLPGDIPTALGILSRSLPDLQIELESPSEGWLQWPMGEYIASFGLEHFEESMDAMVELCQVSRADFAVRPFLRRWPDRTFARLYRLTGHPSPLVRRWCCEGVRPRLPGGQIVPLLLGDPAPIFPILESLKDDPELAVRRSVSNNLHDLAKDRPELVIEICERWQEGAGPEREWVIRHALRSLVKSAHPRALAIQGFAVPPPELVVELSISPRTVVIGESVKLTTVVHNRSSTELALQVDVVIHFLRQDGPPVGIVLKWKAIDLAPSEKVTLSKDYAMSATAERCLEPGRHLVEVQVNGAKLAQGHFTLF